METSKKRKKTKKISIPFLTKKKPGCGKDVQKKNSCVGLKFELSNNKHSFLLSLFFYSSQTRSTNFFILHFHPHHFSPHHFRPLPIVLSTLVLTTFVLTTLVLTTFVLSLSSSPSPCALLHLTSPIPVIQVKLKSRNGKRKFGLNFKIPEIFQIRK